MSDASHAHAALNLLDWKRRIFALYDDFRRASDAEAGWRHWRDTREELYRTHPQSPVPPDRRAGYRSDCFPYDPAYRVVADITDAPAQPAPLPASTGGTFSFSRIGVAHLTLTGQDQALELYWNEGYGGGILLVIADATSGNETYGGGRYVLDTVKGADLGGDAGGLVLDFNFA